MSTEVMSGVDQVGSDWCQSCEDLRQEVEKLNAEHALNYKALKEKIISTDKLIKRYTAKCQEYDSQTKKLDETSKVLQNYKSDCENFESQLKTALEELVPLKQTNQKYEKLSAQLEKKLDKYEVKLQAAESSHKQYSVAQYELEKNNEKLKEEKSGFEKKIKETDILAKKHDAAMKKLQDELDTKKKEISALKKENTSCKKQSGKLQMRSECWTELLKSHGLLRKGRQMFSRWQREKNETFKLNNLVESEDEHSEEDYAAEEGWEEQGTSSSAVARGAGVMRQDSLVEMILTEMIVDDDDSELLDFSYLTPISPAVSPLRPSPSSDEEGPTLTSDEDFTDAAEQLENAILMDKVKKNSRPKGSGKGKKSKKGKLKVIESALGPQGLLEIQESLSDTEQDGETDVPFTRIGVKTRSNSKSQDDGVFKEPLPVSPLRSRKRRGTSLTSLDSKSPLLPTRVTRSSSFPVATSPQRVPPVVPVAPAKSDPSPSPAVAENKETEVISEQTEKQQQQSSDKSEKGQRVLRKKKKVPTATLR